MYSIVLLYASVELLNVGTAYASSLTFAGNVVDTLQLADGRSLKATLVTAGVDHWKTEMI